MKFNLSNLSYNLQFNTDKWINIRSGDIYNKLNYMVDFNKFKGINDTGYKYQSKPQRYEAIVTSEEELANIIVLDKESSNKEVYRVTCKRGKIAESIQSIRRQYKPLKVIIK